MEGIYKIGVLIVTYNRKTYLYKLLEGLKNQSYQINTIFIVDNNSTDGTSDFLIEKDIISNYETNNIVTSTWENININYFKSSVNTGGSGGFNKGIQIILENQEVYDYVWIMDDDVLPRIDCLEVLLQKVNDKHSVVIPNRSTDYFIDKPIHSFNWDRISKSITDKEYIDDDKEINEVVDMPFEGPLIKFDILKKVGPSDDRFFILFDDSDYAQKCLKYTKILFVKNACLKRQILLKNNKYIFNWKHYYFIRNEIVFDKKYNPNKIKPYFRSVYLLLWNILGALKHRDRNRLIYSIKGFFDGHFNRLGKTIEPGSF